MSTLLVILLGVVGWLTEWRVEFCVYLSPRNDEDSSLLSTQFGMALICGISQFPNLGINELRIWLPHVPVLLPTEWTAFSYIYACVSFATSAATAAIGEDLIIIRHPHNNSPSHSVAQLVSQSTPSSFPQWKACPLCTSILRTSFRGVAVGGRGRAGRRIRTTTFVKY